MDEGHCIERAHRSHRSESECPCSTHAGHHMPHLNAVPPIRPGILMASADEPMLQCLAVPRLTRHQVRALNDVQAGESETSWLIEHNRAAATCRRAMASKVQTSAHLINIYRRRGGAREFPLRVVQRSFTTFRILLSSSSKGHYQGNTGIRYANSYKLTMKEYVPVLSQHCPSN